MIEEPFIDYIGTSMSINENWYVENTDKEFNPKLPHQKQNNFGGMNKNMHGNRNWRDNQDD